MRGRGSNFAAETYPQTRTSAGSVNLLPDGNVAAPALAWVADPNLGFYRIGADQFGVSVGTNGLGFAFGNFTIVNLDTAYGHTPATVRYQSRPYYGPLGAANETTAIYCRLDHATYGNVPQYALYIEIDPLQNYTTGGCATKVIHRGHGDAHFVGLLNGIDPQPLVDATNTSPIICTVNDHGFGQGDIVQISGALGNTNANGVWYGITVIDQNTFSLPGSVGNAPYAGGGIAQDIDPPVGYEAAHWGDGCSGFLSSCQRPGGLANMTGYNFLYQADAILNYGGFVGNDVPNNTFVANKRTGLSDAAIDGYTQYSLAESLHRMVGGDGGGGTFKGSWSSTTAYVINDTVAYGTGAYICIAPNTNQLPTNPAFWTNVTDTPNLGRQRLAIYNSGRLDVKSLVASAATPLRDAPNIHQYGSYWDAGAGVGRDYAVAHVFTVTGVTAGTYDLRMGDPAGVLTRVFKFKSDGTLEMLSTGGAITAVHTVTFLGADATNLLDMQTGSIGNVASISGTLVNLQTSGAQFDHYVQGNVAVEYTGDAAIGVDETVLLLRRNVGGIFSLQRVSMGAAGSGGAGFRLLRVPD